MLDLSLINDSVWTIVIGAVSNATCAILGCFLVLRRMSLLSDAISHAVLPGLAFGFIFTGTTNLVPMVIGALVFGFLTAVLTQALNRYGKVPEDTSMGVVFTSLFALGVILIAVYGSSRVHLDKDCVLEGTLDLAALYKVPIFGMDVPVALRSLVPVFLLTVFVVGLFWKELKIASFDPVLATAMGLNAAVIHFALMGMVALASVASFETVGSILVVAMIIVPGATAHLLTDRLARMILLAVIVSLVSAVGGYYWAQSINSSTSGMMAVVAGLQFGTAVIAAPRYGLLSKAINNLTLSLRIVTEDVIAMLYRKEEKRTGPASAAWNECVRFAGGGFIGRLAVPVLRSRRQVSVLPDGRIQLTNRGRASARSLIRSHRLWEAYLGEHFDLPEDHLHEPASRIEHYIGPDLQAKLEQELDQPAHDPHGSTIPPSETPGPD